VEGAIIHDKQTGAVIYTEKTSKISEKDFQEIRESCPYNIPRRDPKTGRISKCTMCFDRISKGMLPACVKACPSGAMNFGDRQKMLDLAKKRLDELKKEYPKAILADAENVNTIYLLIDEPNKYHEFSVAQKSPEMDRKQFLAKMFGFMRRPGSTVARL